MKTRCGIVVLFVALVALLCASLPAAAPATTSLNPYEQQLVKRINDERAERGLAPVRVHDALVSAARAHSAEMGEHEFFSHSSRDGVTWDSRIERFGYTRDGCTSWRAGENIAWGAGLYSSPVVVVDSWMKSSMHRAVILTAAYRDIGVGAVSCSGYRALSGKVWFFTLDLGRRVK